MRVDAALSGGGRRQPDRLDFNDVRAESVSILDYAKTFLMPESAADDHKAEGSRSQHSCLPPWRGQRTLRQAGSTRREGRNSERMQARFTG